MKEVTSWLEVQKEIVRKQEFIAEIEVKTVTLTRLGGYKATPYSLDFKLFTEVNSKALKGVWRWWARTAIIGAYDGLIDYKKAEEILSELLGGTGEGKGISSFRLEVSDIQFPRNYEAELTRIYKAIDDFYEGAKNFLVNQEPKLKSFLPRGTSISISLNPSNPALTIEHEKAPLRTHLKRIENIVEGRPLGKFFPGTPLVKRGNKRVTVSFKIPELNAYPKIPRVKLLLMPRKEETDRLQWNNIDSNEVRRYLKRIKEEISTLISKGLRFKISLYGDREGRKVDFVLSSFLLSLILGGIGSLTKRAFGSLQLLSFKFGENLEIDDEIVKIFNDFKVKPFTSEELENTLKRLCEITIAYAKKLFKVKEVHETHYRTPKVPSLSNIKIKVIECPSCNLTDIGRAFTKEAWKSPSNTKESGRNLHTWILGLPRWQGKTRTGYTIEKDGEDAKRRISSISARCFRSGNRNFIILFGLLSQDWPIDELLHVRGRGQKPIKKKVKEIEIRQKPSVTGASLNDVFEVAFSEVSKRVCRK